MKNGKVAKKTKKIDGGGGAGHYEFYFFIPILCLAYEKYKTSKTKSETCIETYLFALVLFLPLIHILGEVPTESY